MSNVIYGTNNSETIIGETLNDLIKAKVGDVFICGAPWDDKINGGKGNNYMYFYTGDGHDVIENDGYSDYRNSSLYEYIVNHDQNVSYL